MNARSQVLELTVEGHQIDEVVHSLFHAILFQRTTGKYHYTKERNFTIGTVGFRDVHCDFLDFTYVRMDNNELDSYLDKEINLFRDALRSTEGRQAGQISLEFYRKHKNRWLFQSDISPWEVWTIKLDVVTLSNESERQEFKRKLEQQLADCMIETVQVVNRHEYLPRVPPKEEEDTVFDTSFTHIQPYLFRIYHQTSGPGATVGGTVRKFLRGSLTL